MNKFYNNAIKKGKNELILFLKLFPDSSEFENAFEQVYYKTKTLEEKIELIKRIEERNELYQKYKKLIVNQHLEDLFIKDGEELKLIDCQLIDEINFYNLANLSQKLPYINCAYQSSKESASNYIESILNEDLNLEELSQVISNYYFFKFEEKLNKSIDLSKKKIFTFSELMNFLTNLESKIDHQSFNHIILNYKTEFSDLLKLDVPNVNYPLLKKEIVSKLISKNDLELLVSKAQKPEDLNILLEFNSEYHLFERSREFDNNFRDFLRILIEKRAREILKDFESFEDLLEFKKILQFEVVPLIQKQIQTIYDWENLREICQNKGFSFLSYNRPNIKPKEAETLSDWLCLCLRGEEFGNPEKYCNKAIELANTLDDLKFIFYNGRVSYRKDVLVKYLELADSFEDILFVFNESRRTTSEIGSMYWRPSSDLETLAWEKLTDNHPDNPLVIELLSKIELDEDIKADIALENLESNLNDYELCLEIFSEKLRNSKNSIEATKLILNKFNEDENIAKFYKYGTGTILQIYLNYYYYLKGNLSKVEIVKILENSSNSIWHYFSVKPDSITLQEFFEKVYLKFGTNSTLIRLEFEFKEMFKAVGFYETTTFQEFNEFIKIDLLNRNFNIDETLEIFNLFSDNYSTIEDLREFFENLLINKQNTTDLVTILTKVKTEFYPFKVFKTTYSKFLDSNPQTKHLEIVLSNFIECGYHLVKSDHKRELWQMWVNSSNGLDHIRYLLRNLELFDWSDNYDLKYNLKNNLLENYETVEDILLYIDSGGIKDEAWGIIFEKYHSVSNLNYYLNKKKQYNSGDKKTFSSFISLKANWIEIIINELTDPIIIKEVFDLMAERGYYRDDDLCKKLLLQLFKVSDETIDLKYIITKTKKTDFQKVVLHKLISISDDFIDLDFAANYELGEKEKLLIAEKMLN